jgi:hypothetical protein
MGSQRFFGRIVARALGCRLFIDRPVESCDVCHVVGVIDAPTYAHTIESTSAAARLVLHWTGPDARTLFDHSRLPEATHLCESEGVRSALGEREVQAQVLPLPTWLHVPPSPLPDPPVVAAYGGARPVRYGALMVRVLWERFGGTVRFLSFTESQFADEILPEVVSRSSVFLGLKPIEDGALFAREFMEAGRRAVVTRELEFARRVDYEDLASVATALEDALAEGEPDMEAAEHWRRENSDERFVTAIEELV